MDGLVDVDALDRDTGLAAVEGAVVGGEVRRSVEVGVGQDEHRIVAAELETDRGQRAARPLGDPSAGGRGAGERDEVRVSISASPASASPWTTAKTPSGSPHSLSMRAMSSAVRGVPARA
jgi:hypothetical protein